MNILVTEGGNQKLYFEKGHAIQWPRKSTINYLQNTTQKTKD